VTVRGSSPFWASLFIYIAATAGIGRDVLAHASTAAMHDSGDPLLTAAILHWTTTHLPLSDAWWQFPIFYPTRDTLAFSEHLLGISVIATPLEWITGNVMVTYNVMALLTFPLSAVAMYALVWRLTRSHPAAFIGGLVFGFAPYRISQAPHIQMLALFWAPVALLGLHAYVETRRARWLAVYAASWALQVAANGYALVFFSLLVAFWTAWFVIARRDWAALVRIAIATGAGTLTLAPILYKYLTVHAHHGFARSVEEIQGFSADLGAVLCAPELLTFWGWVRVHCKAEGELFPGAATAALFAIGVVLLVVRRRADEITPRSRMWQLSSRVFGIIAVAYWILIVSILVFGPWRVDVGLLHASVSSLRKLLLVALPATVLSMALSPRVRATVFSRPVLGFYVLAAVLTWSLSLGPVVTSMGTDTHATGPFTLLMSLPGVNSLRVPARFWMMTIVCLGVIAGLVVAELLESRRRVARGLLTTAVAVLVLGDGWVNSMPAAPVEPSPFAPATLVDRVVLRLPVQDVVDISETYDSVVGGWRSINGYSGYGPNYYPALMLGVRAGDGTVFGPFRNMTDVHLLVSNDDGALLQFAEGQPGVQRIAALSKLSHYLLPRQGLPSEGRSAGTRIPVATAHASCNDGSLAKALDGDASTVWSCEPSASEQTIDIDLGTTVMTGAVVDGIGRYGDQFPRDFTVETSRDRVEWTPAWRGGLAGQTIRGGLDDPKSIRIVIPYAPRMTRYLRLRHPPAPDYYWVITELEIWSSNTGVPD
jgi:F5/8 type C domain